MRLTKWTSLCALVALTASTAQAAFMVEAHSSGKANATNFAILPGAGNATGATASAKSTAAGTTATNSIFGSNNNIAGVVDTYQFSYTPGLTNPDNTVYLPGAVLGDTRLDPPGNPGGVSAEAQTASGLVGGLSGNYKVYVTWPASNNVHAAGSTITITNNGAPIVLNPVNINSTPATATPSGIGGANKWLLIGEVPLTSGATYTVTMASNVDAFVSQRAHGVMWELQIPEPGTLSLAAMGLVGMIAAGRRKS